MKASLILSDGALYEGLSLGAEGTTTGEVVFNTAMTGYQEILTDPSYARQLVTLTYPHIGNTGVVEGSYGSDGDGSERPEDSATPGCDLPRDLSGSCSSP